MKSPESTGIAAVKAIVLQMLSDPSNYDQPHPLIASITGGLPRLSNEAEERLIVMLQSHDPDDISRGIVDCILSDDPRFQNRLLLGQLNRISQAAIIRKMGE